MSRPLPQIMTPTESYVFRYPEFAKLADTQMEIFWPWNEIKVEKDKQDLLTNLDKAEKHGVMYLLKLFLKYELFIGNEYWMGRVLHKFPRPEIARMAAAFGHVELNSHAPFYNKINEELGIATDEFYTSYVNDPALAVRMAFINEMVDSDDDLLSVASFSMMEGSVLYTQFGYLKHFQTTGKNKIPNVNRGVNMSAIDENLHAIGGAGIFRKALEEMELSLPERKELADKIYAVGEAIRAHEHIISSHIMAEGEPDGITLKGMCNFADHRVDLCLEQLGLEPIFKPKENPIAETFYDGLNKYQFNDFFSGIGREYTRGWDKKSFIWTPRSVAR